MCDHPWDFYRGFEWGVDLVWAGSEGALAHPNQLARALMKEVGATTIDDHFLPRDVEQWAERFREKLKESRAWKY